MSSDVEIGTVTTNIPARLDRLPWARFHWMVIVGLGTVWILDGLEVTIVGSMSEALKSPTTGLGMSSTDIGVAGAVYVAGACLGALVFGQLTDRFGRKKLFIITLVLYTVATVLTAFSMNPMWYFVCRFFTGAGIGGEYAAINSAIDELIPKDFRGRVDVVINGSFWVGAAAGALLTLPLLDPTLVNPAYGWRIAFGLGAVLAVGVLIVRRHVPESPRWLFIHGRESEAEDVVTDIEHRITADGHELAEPEGTITVHQRRSIGMGLIAKTVFTSYPKRTVVCFGLFVGQAFLYNAFFFTFGDTLTTFLGVKQTGGYIAVVRGRELPRCRAAQPVVRHPRPAADDRGDVHHLGRAAGDRRSATGQPDRGHADRGRRGDLLLRVGRCQLGVPDRERDLPDGDPGDVHRLLLCDRYGGRRDQRTTAVRFVDRRTPAARATSPRSRSATTSAPR